MWQAIGRAAHRADQGGDGAQPCRRAWSVASINNRFAIGFTAAALGGHLLVESVIKEDDFAFHLVFA